MARLLTLVLFLTCVIPASAEVLPGIDIMAKRNFDLLKDKRVGLITNHTGRSSNGTSTIDLIANAPDVHLIALFSPEHGIRGESDVKLPSGIDVKTGLPVFSLYGSSCRPTPEMMQGIELLVFDIQDIGSRFYTYIGTLHHALLAARNSKIPVVVLDRPNPLNGLEIGGAVPDRAEVTQRIAADLNGCRSLTITHPIPVRHGMTVAELARMINHENNINADLRIVPMSGWSRSMLWQQTGLSWVNPSPNMKDPVAALLYSGLGSLEATNLSVARGTDKPFHRYGAPWMDSDTVLKQLPELPGLRFNQVSFSPTAPGHPYRNQGCNGIEITVTDPLTADPALAGLHLAQAIYTVHPKQYQVRSGFHTMQGDRSVWDRLTTKMEQPSKIISGWQDGIRKFRQLREQYLLY